MPIIHPKGSPSSRIWVITEAPLSSDIPKGYMFSGGAGWVFEKMMQDAAINDYYVICRRPDSDDPASFHIIENDLNHYKPPLILAMDLTAAHLCDEVKANKGQKSHKTQLGKYIGSLLSASSGLLNYPHYIMPLWGMDKYLQDWSERNIGAYFDLQKIRLEYEYWKKHGVIQPLPFRQMIYQDMLLDNLIDHIRRFRNDPLISVDIETIYPKGESIFKPHPGYPITLGIANSPSFGISFNLFRESRKETCFLWREVNELLSKVSNLGQNYFNFDTHFLSALGFDIKLDKCIDTLIRHHVLWPELPHKLQFQTRQYTREPYYKDEGHAWNLKNMAKLRRYNCLDVCVTYEIYLQQEDEFRERKEVA
jgi:hypothetical protein